MKKLTMKVDFVFVTELLAKIICMYMYKKLRFGLNSVVK